MSSDIPNGIFQGSYWKQQEQIRNQQSLFDSFKKRTTRQVKKLTYTKRNRREATECQGDMEKFDENSVFDTPLPKKKKKKKKKNEQHPRLTKKRKTEFPEIPTEKSTKKLKTKEKKKSTKKKSPQEKKKKPTKEKKKSTKENEIERTWTTPEKLGLEIMNGTGIIVGSTFKDLVNMQIVSLNGWECEGFYTSDTFRTKMNQRPIKIVFKKYDAFQPPDEDKRQKFIELYFDYKKNFFKQKGFGCDQYSKQMEGLRKCPKDRRGVPNPSEQTIDVYLNLLKQMGWE